MTKLELIRNIIELSREAQRMETVARKHHLQADTLKSRQEASFWNNAADLIHVCSCNTVRALEDSLSD